MNLSPPTGRHAYNAYFTVQAELLRLVGDQVEQPVAAAYELRKTETHQSYSRSCPLGPVRLSYNPYFLTCFFSWNSVFLSQQIHQNSVSACFFQRN